MHHRVFIGLVHYPIYNKHMEIVTTSITNLDIHDIARSAITYDLDQYFLIHPHENQHEMAQDLIDYWTKGYGAQYNPDRAQALERIRLVPNLEEVRQWIESHFPGPICQVVTDARIYPNTVSYANLRRQIQSKVAQGSSPQNFLLLFGTGYGLSQEIMAQADMILEPIIGRGPYNHLSVRSAVAIILDRLLAPDRLEEG